MPGSLLGRKWTWRNRVNATLVLVICAGLVAFLGVAVVSNYQAADDAVASLNRARALTARRIDLLNRQIDRLSTQNAHASRQRGLLLAEVRALTRQLAALGVTPVVTEPPAPRSASRTVVIRPTPRPTVTRTTTAEPQPTHTPSRSPEPTPSCPLGMKLPICPTLTLTGR